MWQATKTMQASVPTRGRIFAVLIILFAGIVAAGFRPVTVTAQESAKPTIDEESEDAILLAKFDKRRWSELTEAERDEFGSLTKRMYEKSPDDLAAKSRYADLLIASKDFRTALTILRDLANDQPSRGLQAAAVARKLGLNEEANAIAERSLKALSTMSEQDPTNIAVSLAMAQNQLFLKRFDAAIKTLDKAITLAKSPREHQVVRQAFGDATVAHLNHIEGTSTGTVADRLRILEMLKVAVKRSPKNPRVLTAVSNRLRTTHDDDNEQITKLRAEIRTALDEAKVNENEKAKDES